jgi:hypothetical protein
VDVEKVVGLATTVDERREVEDPDDGETLVLPLDLVLPLALAVELPTKLDDSGAAYRRH